MEKIENGIGIEEVMIFGMAFVTIVPATTLLGYCALKIMGVM